MARSLIGRPRWALPVIVALLASLSLLPAADAPAQSPDGKEMPVVAQRRFGFGTDLDFRGRVVVAGSGLWDGRATPDSGIHLFRLRRDGVPKPIGFANCRGWHSDVGIWRGYAFQSHDSGSDNKGCGPGRGEEGIRVFNIRNPRRPRSIGFAKMIHGSHNFTVVGNTGLLYNASYNLTDPTDVDGVSIVNVRKNPRKPRVRFLEFPDPTDDSPKHRNMKNRSGVIPTSMGCHDIGLDLRRDLAYCAGITETQIWDISKPAHPVIISIIHNPGISIHHGAIPNGRGDILVINDEWLGAAGANTGCVAPRQPSGALWFYDISDPKNPTPLSYWSPTTPDPVEDFCTSHFFDPFNKRDWLVTSWYDHGVYVVDFSNPLAPTAVAKAEPDGATFWSAYVERGHIYGGSFAPATLTGSDAANSAGGLWAFDLPGWGRGR